MYQLGKRAGVTLDYNVQTNWQPVDSQRVMLWAATFGKQEDYMDVLARGHFEKKKSASHHSSIIEAALEVGLPEAPLMAFLKSEELKDEVWRSYGTTIRNKRIEAIPLFIFNGPTSNDGPFRSGKTGRAIIHHGSGDPEQFKQVFDDILRKTPRQSL